MVDHKMFSTSQVGLYFVEVKSSGACRLNGPWSNPRERAIYLEHCKRLERHPSHLVEIVARELYVNGGSSVVGHRLPTRQQLLHCTIGSWSGVIRSGATNLAGTSPVLLTTGLRATV